MWKATGEAWSRLPLSGFCKGYIGPLLYEKAPGLDMKSFDQSSLASKPSSTAQDAAVQAHAAVEMTEVRVPSS